MELEIHTTENQKDSTGFLHFSSAPSYDNALGSIFPYFAVLTDEQATEISGLLSRGYNEQLRIFTPTSFALVTTFDFIKSRILWLSASSVEFLKLHPDLYTMTFATNPVNERE